MPLSTVSVSPGAAYAALAEAIAHAKQGDVLAPVTVVVPTNATGVTARRLLGRTGIAGVDMLTLGRIAELLAGPALAAAGRRPVSVPIVELAVADLLRSRSGPFQAVAEHPSTVIALRELHEELRRAGPGAPGRLAAASGRGRDAAEVSVALAGRLAEGGWYDAADLLERAAAAARSGNLPARLARVIVFLPHPLLGLDAGLVEALAERADVTMIAQAEPPADAVAAAAGQVELATATDADEEVRHAVRAVVMAARDGVPFARMAIAWPANQPYARLVEHHLCQAGVPWNGRPGTLVTERVVPRFLLNLLDVDRRGLRRTDLFDLLADVELHGPAGGRLPVARWERVARRAGVAGAGDWNARLTRFAAAERARAAERDEPTSGSRSADAADALAGFVNALLRDLGPRTQRRTWAEWVAWAVAQVDARLGATFLARLAEPEHLAWDHTTRVLDRLATLDAVSGPVDRATFRAVFEAEFDAAPGRLGRIGVGVGVGGLAGMVGTDLDLAIVLGAADGDMPPRPDSGPLIGDADRAAAGLPPSDTSARRLHRQFAAVLATTPRVLVTLPRGDLRGATDRHASRWVAAALATPPPHVRVVTLQSHHHTLLHATPFPAHATEHRLRAGLAGAPPPDELRGAAQATRAARREPAITVYDGDLTGVPIDHFERPVSPTRLEQWAACPHAYFVRYLLGVLPVDDPQAEYDMAANERGMALHEVLDRLHHEVLDGHLPSPLGGWSGEHLHRALELFDEVTAGYEASGRTGRPASWHVERAALRTDLVGWLATDSARLAANQATIVSSEFTFGGDGTVTLTLPTGETLRVYGQIDRVDRTSTGALIVVDHKSGSTRKFEKITPADPTAGGTRFQLPVYAAGALAASSDGPAGLADVEAYYSFFGAAGYKRIGYRFTPDVQAEVAARLGELVAGIRSGLFAARPEKPGFQLWVECHYCEPDALGTAERYSEWERKRHDPRGARWFADPDEASVGDAESAA